MFEVGQEVCGAGGGQLQGVLIAPDCPLPLVLRAVNRGCFPGVIWRWAGQLKRLWVPRVNRRWVPRVSRRWVLRISRRRAERMRLLFFCCFLLWLFHPGGSRHLFFNNNNNKQQKHFKRQHAPSVCPSVPRTLNSSASKQRRRFYHR